MELRYSKSPLDTTSVFKFFVIDAQEVQTTYNSGVPSNQILWKVTLPSCLLSLQRMAVISAAAAIWLQLWPL